MSLVAQVSMNRLIPCHSGQVLHRNIFLPNSLKPPSLTPHPKTVQKNSLKQILPTFVDFFAGSGLVTQGVRHACLPVWSNDVCPKKAAIYTANHGADHFHLGSIEQVKGAA